MLNEERVILMTRMAAYEKGEGKQNVKIGNFFRSDYLSVELLKSVVCSTVAFLVVCGLYVLYDFEVFMQDLYKLDLLALGMNVLMYYVVTVVGYGLLVYIACSVRYAKARKSLKCYYQNLKKLNALYNEEK